MRREGRPADPSKPWAWALAVLATFALLMLVAYGVALLDARLTRCPEIAAGRQDGISFIGQGISLWPVGARCHNQFKDQFYVYETAGWLVPVLAALGGCGLVLAAVTFKAVWGGDRSAGRPRSDSP